MLVLKERPQALILPEVLHAVLTSGVGPTKREQQHVADEASCVKCKRYWSRGCSYIRFTAALLPFCRKYSPSLVIFSLLRVRAVAALCLKESTSKITLYALEKVTEICSTNDITHQMFTLLLYSLLGYFTANTLVSSGDCTGSRTSCTHE